MSLFPVQPWLDVPELGFGVTVTTWGPPAAAQAVADSVAQAAWNDRFSFAVDVHDVGSGGRRVAAGIRMAARSCWCSRRIRRPQAPQPTAPSSSRPCSCMDHRVRSYATVVDAPAALACHAAGVGADIDVLVGATLDPRWSAPVALSGRVTVPAALQWSWQGIR